MHTGPGPSARGTGPGGARRGSALPQPAAPSPTGAAKRRTARVTKQCSPCPLPRHSASPYLFLGPPGPLHHQQHSGQLQSQGTGPALLHLGGKRNGIRPLLCLLETMPHLPHLLQGSLELAQARRASEEVLVQSQGLLGATREPWAPRYGCLLHGVGEPGPVSPPSSPLLLSLEKGGPGMRRRQRLLSSIMQRPDI